MGAVVTDPGTKARLKVLQYTGGTLQVFDPGANHIDVLHAGANQAQYEGFLTFGFGGSGRDLARAWNITDQGSETINDAGEAVKVEKLDLTGKDENVRNMFTHVTVWIDLARGVSLKQVFYTPSGDIRTAIYSHIQLNTRDRHQDLRDQDERLDLPQRSLGPGSESSMPLILNRP